MTFIKPALFAGLAGAILLSSFAAAQARPVGPQPSACKPSVASSVKKAKSQSKAKQRARGSWESQARRAYGLAWNSWSDAAGRNYGCSKKGKWHHCIAEAYACKKPYYG